MNRSAQAFQALLRLKQDTYAAAVAASDLGAGRNCRQCRSNSSIKRITCFHAASRCPSPAPNARIAP